jgi:hypothetical protein
MTKPIRWATALTVVGLGGVAAVVSFRHALEVVQEHGETRDTAMLYPLTIDGLVFASSMVLLDSARRGEQAPPLAKWTLGIGIGATVAVNVLHGIAHGFVGAVIAAWPALALVLTVELMMGLIRRGQQAAVDLATEAADLVEAVESAPTSDPELTAPTAVADEDLNNLDEDDDPAQKHLDAMIANMKLANQAGISQERIAEMLGTKRHKIAPLIKTPVPATESEPASEINGHVLNGVQL